MEPEVKNRIIEMLSLLVVVQRVIGFRNEAAANKVLIASSWLHLTVKGDKLISPDDMPPRNDEIREVLEGFVGELGDIRVSLYHRSYTEHAMTNLQEALFLLKN